MIDFFPAKGNVKRTVSELYEALVPFENRPGTDQLVDADTNPIEVTLLSSQSYLDKPETCFVKWDAADEDEDEDVGF